MKRYISLLLMSVSATKVTGFNSLEESPTKESNSMATTAEQATEKPTTSQTAISIPLLDIPLAAIDTTDIVNDLANDDYLIGLLVRVSRQDLVLTPFQILLQDPEIKKNLLNGIMTKLTHTQVSAMIQELEAKPGTPVISRLMRNLISYRDTLPKDTSRVAAKTSIESLVVEPEQDRLEDGVHTVAIAEGGKWLNTLRELTPSIADFSKAAFDNIIEEMAQYYGRNTLEYISKYKVFIALANINDRDQVIPVEFTDDDIEIGNGATLHEILIRFWALTSNPDHDYVRELARQTLEEAHDNVRCLQAYTTGILQLSEMINN